MKPPRVPYPERPEVIERHCTCLWTHAITPDGERYASIHSADPDCKLHGPGHDLPDNF